jgi:hypothetical protein
MGALPTIKKFLTDDFPGQASWIGNLLYPLNLLLNTVYSNLNNGLTFSQNLLGQVNSLSVTGANPTTTFNYKFSGQGSPAAVWIGAISGSPALTAAVSISWSYSAGTVSVTVQGLPKSGTYNITFLTSGG